ncbi:wall-associated receptor kinase-like 6 isoform X4 [Gossypium raimondii]|uniref:wall-associated receptor kinase-like 6 isoform X4 n=1 Tax=Gossypium raimondii TaxID=29730 RepID=UPI00227A0D5A|nr:wall-associated receptor kinase-like 6 isoform X4 [Gossypium raimondii]
MGFHLPLYFLFLFLLCPILQAAEFQEPTCGKEVCGNITITSPFGIHSRCYTHPSFSVTCNQTLNGTKPFINVNGIDLEVLGKALYSNAILINYPVTYINCNRINEASVRVNLSGTPFFFSSDMNYFGSVGCGNLATILRSEADSLGGCSQPRCDDGASESGCFTEITANLTSYTVKMRAMYPDSKGCASAFIFSKYSFRDAYPLPSGINKGTTHVPAVLNWNSSYCGEGGCVSINFYKGLNSFYVNMSSSDYRRKRSCGFASMISIDYDLKFGISNKAYVPTRLQWGTPILGECHLNDSSNTYCTSDGQYCWSMLSSKHLCVCYSEDFGYSSSCQDEKCENYKYCSMLCLNTPSNYCSSKSCPPHYEFNSTGFRCERKIHTQKKHIFTSIIVGCSTSVGTLFLLLATWSMYKVLKRKQKIMLKQKYFKRNGGLLLQQHLSSNEGNVEKIKLFTSKEMEKATNHYNENRILGQGGQGTVYKGMLIDGSIVAIKKSKMVEGKKFDEKKVEQFINEVIILSQINHRNVVKLLGCCLEAEVPLLVYEFIPNGTLYDLIHNQNEELPLTWEMRLRIAIEIANALFYLHSAASAPIYHRDIKSSNILLDDKYRAKVSDFGTSKSVALEQTHLTTRVQGTFGYMDPEYFRSSQFTEKSDVYSFGVVLIELLTGQKPISAEQSEPVRSLVSYFLDSMQENSLFNILDPMVVKDGPEQEIIVVALLAKRCLNLNGKKRPTMKQVAMELELIKASGGNIIEDHGDEEYEIDDIIHSWESNPSSSMPRTITSNSETFPLNSSF